MLFVFLPFMRISSARPCTAIDAFIVVVLFFPSSFTIITIMMMIIVIAAAININQTNAMKMEFNAALDRAHTHTHTHNHNAVRVGRKQKRVKYEDGFYVCRSTLVYILYNACACMHTSL